MTFLNSLVVLAAEVNIKMVTNSHFFKGHLNLSGPKVTFMIAKTVFAWTKKVTFSKKPRMYRRIKKISGENKLSKSTLKSICFLWQSEMNETGRNL